MVLNDPGLIHASSALVLDCLTARTSCRFAELRERSWKATRKALRTRHAAPVHVVPSKAMCVEASQYRLSASEGSHPVRAESIICHWATTG